MTMRKLWTAKYIEVFMHPVDIEEFDDYIPTLACADEDTLIAEGLEKICAEVCEYIPPAMDRNALSCLFPLKALDLTSIYDSISDRMLYYSHHECKELYNSVEKVILQRFLSGIHDVTNEGIYDAFLFFAKCVLHAFIKDVTTVWVNCTVYNGRDADFGKVALTHHDTFIKKLNATLDFEFKGRNTKVFRQEMDNLILQTQSCNCRPGHDIRPCNLCHGDILQSHNREHVTGFEEVKLTGEGGDKYSTNDDICHTRSKQSEHGKKVSKKFTPLMNNSEELGGESGAACSTKRSQQPKKRKNDSCANADRGKNGKKNATVGQNAAAFFMTKEQKRQQKACENIEKFRVQLAKSREATGVFNRSFSSTGGDDSDKDKKLAGIFSLNRKKKITKPDESDKSINHCIDLNLDPNLWVGFYFLT